MNSTLERLGEILVRENKVAPERLRPEAALEDLGIDSLGLVEVLWHVEATFGIELPLDTSGLHTLGDLARHIDQLAARQGVARRRA